jgi:hypothetical protein
VIGTYAAVLAVCGASLVIGQAAIMLCGGRRWSWLAPAVGLALLCAVCWGAVRLGDGAFFTAVTLLMTVSVVYLRGRLEGGGEALRAGWLVALFALLAASLPFLVEGHFGILGTSFNPDMSQHLLAADRLAHGHESQLLNQGYPLGPHAIVVTLEALGIGLVQGFSGLTVAVAILAGLTALAAFAELRPLPRTAGALLVGLAYVVASYFAQGAFKETMQALFVLAFVLALRESTRSWHDLPLRFVPAALIAVGSVYTYSFAGLIWLVAAAAIWVLLDSVVGKRRPALRELSLGLLVFFVLIAPEIGRMLDFQRFETFDPNGPGLGNLFGQISPFEALGIWPSGDFRLAPGDGAVPAAGYYLGVAFAFALFLLGLVQCWRRRESALLAGIGAAALVYVAARTSGTPYTAAKAIEVAAPLVALTILVPLLGPVELRLLVARGRKVWVRPWDAAAAAVFALAAGLSSVLVLANAPVGPTAYSPALAGLRPLIADDSTLVLASPELIDEQHGTPFIAWELRGGRVCIAREGELSELPPGVRFLVTRGAAAASSFPALRVRRVAAPYVLWEATGPVRGRSPCPLIAVRQARQGPAR